LADTPYAAPKSKVDDVAPAPPKYILRTKWFYLGLLVFLVVITLWLFQDLPLPALALIWGLAIGALVSVNPMQMLFARRRAVAPWWWNIVFYSIVGGWLGGAVFDDEFIIAVGLVAMLAFMALSTVGAFWVEARYKVRAYSTAFGVGFVGEDAR